MHASTVIKAYKSIISFTGLSQSVLDLAKLVDVVKLRPADCMPSIKNNFELAQKDLSEWTL